MYQNRFEQVCPLVSKLLDEKVGRVAQAQLKNNVKVEISQMPSGKLSKGLFVLSWSQYVFLIGIKDETTRNFYEIEAASNGWTLPELTRQFNSSLYERLALSRDKEGVQKLAKEFSKRLFIYDKA